MARRTAVILMAGVFGFSGCASNPEDGYAWETSFRDDIKTVSVPMWENTTFDHGFEAVLTDALVKEIHRTTPWRVAKSGETTLSGTVTSSELRKLSTNRDSGLVQEVGYEVGVRFDWTMNRDGEVLVARRNFRAAEGFVPSPGAGERSEIGRQAVADELAKQIVSELRSSW
jgi:hypothetical protein